MPISVVGLACRSACRSALTREHSSAARPVRSSVSKGSASDCLASSRLASRISSISWSSSVMLRRISSFAAMEVMGDREFSDGPPLGKLAPSGGSAVREATSVGVINSRLMRIRASGERNSCEALASNDLCESIRVSMRSAAWLKRPARKATSSLPCRLIRADRSPLPQRSTPRCRASRRSVRRRMMG